MKSYHDYKQCIDACLQCAAICNHCASSCTQEEDVKMMAKCIQTDMECAAICYAAAQLMSLEAAKQKTFVASAQIYVKNVEMNAANMKWCIAENVQKRVNNVLRRAGEWRLNRLIVIDFDRKRETSFGFNNRNRNKNSNYENK